MNRRPGRFNLQLTPLLDLLLIVIFAQYLDVQEQAQQESVQSQQQVEQSRREYENRLTADRQALAEIHQQQLAELEQQRNRLAAQQEALTLSQQVLANRQTTTEQQVSEMIAQQMQAASLMAELFQVPKSLIDEALKPLPAGVPSRTVAEQSRLRGEFEKLAAARGAEVVEFLLSYDELRKRADVWTIHVDTNGTVHFSAAGSEQLFRVSTPEDFASSLFDRYKRLPQPKGLVVLLVSFGDARADIRQAVITGLPDAVRRMRDDRLGQTQFEYAVLGFMPDQKTPPGTP